MNQTPQPDEPTARLDASPTSSARGARPRLRMTLLLAAAAVVLLLVGGAVGYLLGHQGASPRAAGVGPTAQSSNATGPGGWGFGGHRGHGRGGRGAAGTIDSVNGSTITLTTRNGRKVTVTAAPNVAVTVRSQGTVADLKPGQTVVVAGRAGTDGNITANRIDVGPGAPR
ncbi:MAG TPA: DUF5666 domain-containing protein [Pseudonocardiaceae bacterium]